MDNYRVYKHCLVWNGDPSKEVELTSDEAIKYIKEHKCLMLRNIYDWDCEIETNYWFIIKDYYNKEDYPKKTKKYIEKANDRFKYEIISKQLLLDEGYEIYKKAYSNYKINDGFKLSENDFFDNINNLHEDVDFWGGIDKETGKLEAYSICKKGDRYCEFQTSKANPEFLPRFYIFYGLYDARNKYYLNDKAFEFVISSARSVSEHSNVQNFMMDKMLFRKAYCRIKMHYSPIFNYIIKAIYPFSNFIKYPPIKNMLKFESLNRGKNW